MSGEQSGQQWRDNNGGLSCLVEMLQRHVEATTRKILQKTNAIHEVYHL